MKPLKILFITGFLSANCFAHVIEQDDDFCVRGHKHLYMSADYDGRTLAAFFENGNTVNCPVGIKIEEGFGSTTERSHSIADMLSYRSTGTRRHTIFDQSEKVTGIANCFCASALNRDVNLKEIQAQVTGPESLFDPNHHFEYEFEHGLSFDCYICDNGE